ncbi:MAG: CinA family protein [Lachnospiraceae bacterium]|nr:CinA family protein [Lachnospiraceae bacterium]
MALSLEEQLVNRLIEKNWHISCAESCTGGLVAAHIVNVANASSVLDVSFVTYANEAKMKYVNVSPDTIAAYGVVSEEVVREMALGVAEAAGSEVGIGISGIAGPGGGTDKKPVGMVCFGFSVNGTVTTRTMQFGAAGRNEVRRRSTEYALQTMLELLSGIVTP